MNKRRASGSFFEKKEPKKLSTTGPRLIGQARFQTDESLFASFSSEKEVLP
jgi:hypothetical protein